MTNFPCELMFLILHEATISSPSNNSKFLQINYWKRWPISLSWFFPLSCDIKEEKWIQKELLYRFKRATFGDTLGTPPLNLFSLSQTILEFTNTFDMFALIELFVKEKNSS